MDEVMGRAHDRLGHAAEKIVDLQEQIETGLVRFRDIDRLLVEVAAIRSDLAIAADAKWRANQARHELESPPWRLTRFGFIGGPWGAGVHSACDEFHNLTWQIIVPGVPATCPRRVHCDRRLPVGSVADQRVHHHPEGDTMNYTPVMWRRLEGHELWARNR